MSGVVGWKDLKLVTQDDGISCGVAALAMVCGTDLDTMRRSLGVGRCGPREWRDYLRKCHRLYLEMHETLSWDGLWFVIVPSPNRHGQTHVVILDCRPCAEGEPARWYDPQDGNYQNLHWTFDDWTHGRVVHAVGYKVVPILESPEA